MQQVLYTNLIAIVPSNKDLEIGVIDLVEGVDDTEIKELLLNFEIFPSEYKFNISK